MFTQFISIGLLMLFSVMLPGPDFALVTKNTISHSRRAGIFTTLGIAAGVLIHLSYCVLGLALVISQSLLLFNIIKYLGALYLIYLGISSLLSSKAAEVTAKRETTSSTIQDHRAFGQGFLCNILNPKATLFFLALFTVIIKPDTPRSLALAYATEMLLIVLVWFSSLTLLLSHPFFLRLFNKAEKYIAKALGIFLIGFGVGLAMIKL